MWAERKEIYPLSYFWHVIGLFGNCHNSQIQLRLDSLSQSVTVTITTILLCVKRVAMQAKHSSSCCHDVYYSTPTDAGVYVVSTKSYIQKLFLYRPSVPATLTSAASTSRKPISVWRHFCFWGQGATSDAQECPWKRHGSQVFVPAGFPTLTVAMGKQWKHATLIVRNRFGRSRQEFTSLCAFGFTSQKSTQRRIWQ